MSRDQLARDIQAWVDEKWFIPLCTKPPERSSISLADHLTALGWTTTDAVHRMLQEQKDPEWVPDTGDEE